MCRKLVKTKTKQLGFLVFSAFVVALFISGDAFAQNIDQLMREKNMQAKKIDDMQSERADLIKEMRRMENLNRKYTQEIDTLRAEMQNKEKAFEERLVSLEDASKRVQYQEKRKNSSLVKTPTAPTIQPIDLEDETYDILLKGSELDPEDKKFREELARAHYNMGNIFFQKGEYHRAVVEYYQAVDLTPYDADAHYNLAFVSSEYLGDQATALKHYKWYLYLNPKADDIKVIHEKIAQAKIHLRSQIDSPINEEDAVYNLAQ